MALSLLDRDQPGLQVLADSLPVRVICTTGDVAREDDLQRFYGQTMDAFGRVDLLVNNAAVKAGAGPWDHVAGWPETRLLPSSIWGQKKALPRLPAMPPIMPAKPQSKS
ncbi:SDR family NAD(P)-dependent oxidoreductase [Escherichia coli]|nr:SDR family NAD(P)-dependent oxidoreductase [Escherichia coli]MDT9448281.1 SDR family NAD(P)-dependent oxidoreductase [Escherichia coli]